MGKLLLTLGVITLWAAPAQAGYLVFNTQAEAKLAIDVIDVALGFPLVGMTTRTAYRIRKTTDAKYCFEVIPTAATKYALNIAYRGKFVDVENAVLSVAQKAVLVPAVSLPLPSDTVGGL